MPDNQKKNNRANISLKINYFVNKEIIIALLFIFRLSSRNESLSSSKMKFIDLKLVFCNDSV